MEATREADLESTPTSSRSAFMRIRRRSTRHPITFLSQSINSKKLREFQYEYQEHEQQEQQNSSMESANTSGASTSTTQTISDDSGIDVSQENRSGHGYFLRKRYKNSF